MVGGAFAAAGRTVLIVDLTGGVRRGGGGLVAPEEGFATSGVGVVEGLDDRGVVEEVGGGATLALDRGGGEAVALIPRRASAAANAALRLLPVCLDGGALEGPEG